MKTHTIVVLGDGETWSMVEGCSVCIITDEEMQALLVGDIDPRDLAPVAELSLRDNTPKQDF